MELTTRLKKPLTVWQRQSKRAFLAIMKKFSSPTYQLHIKHDDGEVVVGEGKQPVTMLIRDADFYTRVIAGGTLGFADAYIEGLWECDHLYALFCFGLENNQTAYRFERQVSGLQGLWHKYYLWKTRNSENGSQENIHQHYDLGNDLFRLFLDETLQYSSAIYNTETLTLAAAQQEKLQRLCEDLQLRASDHLLEIGTGWGGLAIYAAKHYDCHVTTTTISQAQHDYASALIQRENLQDKITILLQDYRQLQGQYDKVVSVEMIEAVGHNYLPVYLQCCNDLLKDDGQLLLQAIIINDQSYPSYRHQVDFIKKYIFPGGCLPSLQELLRNSAHKTNLQLLSMTDISDSYVKTLHAWRDRFLQAEEAILQLGFDHTFMRSWQYYFDYCAAGFAQKYIMGVHLLWRKHSF